MITGHLNMMIDPTDRRRTEQIGQRLATIVECSDDAIISKDLDGVIINQFISSTLRIFVRLFQTPAQKIDASAMMRTACSTGAAVHPKGPNGIHRSVQSDQ